MPSIYHTPDGAILKTPDGKLIKEPYNFGNAFKNKDGLNSYILINFNPVYIDNGLSFISMIKNSSYGPTFITKGNTVDNYNRFIIKGFGGGFCRETPSIPSSTGIFSPNTPGDLLNTIIPNATILNNANSGAYGTTTYLNTTVKAGTLTPAYFDKAAFPCTSSNVTSTNIIPTNYSTTILTNRFTLFSRPISSDEYRYFYNNGLGNDYQSFSSVVFDLLCNYAEVINISGVDQPCVRDYSGNNYHGIIMNLPAGTAQQKVDFANANLFVPFQ